MKRTLLFFTLCTFVVLSNATERIVHQPPFVAWSSSVLEIERIVLSDTATIFYIDAYYPSNNSIMIAPDSYLQTTDQTKYTIQNTKGIELGKEIIMPESGTISFTLSFPPLPENTKEVDFMEGEWNGAFCIWGIRLDGQSIKTTLNGKINSNKNATLEPPVFKLAEATFSGQIAGYSSNMNFRGSLYVSNILTGNSDELIFPVQENGSFSINVPLIYIQRVSLYSPFMNSSFFLKPGETTSVEINLPEIARKQSTKHKATPSFGDIYFFNGALADLNNAISNSPLYELPLGITQEEYKGVSETILNMTPEQYKSFWIKRYEKSLEVLDDYPDINETVREHLIMNGKIELALNLLNGENDLTDAYKDHYKIKNETQFIDSIKATFTKSYYDFLPQLIPTNSFALYSPDFNYFLDRISYRSLNGVPFLSKEKDARQSLFAELIGDSADHFIFDLIDIRNTIGSIINFTPITEQQLAEAEDISPEIRKYLSSLNKQLRQTIEENKKETNYTVNPVDTKDIPKEDLFAAITKPYRGKVIFVDFWATWCGPCIKAMKEAEPVKTAFKESEVVFLYLAGENSPMEIWKQRKLDIKGEHYRVTDEQWSYWSKKFNIQGVPSYMIIGKDGNPAHFQIGFMGAEKMKKFISSELEK